MNPKYILFTLLLPFVMISCKKEAEKKPDTTPKTKTEMISSVTWIYNEYYINYNEANTLLAYKRYKPIILYDLSKSKLKYNTDGTYTETLESGLNVSGTWRFIENETKIELHINQQVITIKVIFINATNFQWASSNEDVLGRMIPMQ